MNTTKLDPITSHPGVRKHPGSFNCGLNWLIVRQAYQRNRTIYLEFPSESQRIDSLPLQIVNESDQSKIGYVINNILQKLSVAARLGRKARKKEGGMPRLAPQDPCQR